MKKYVCTVCGYIAEGEIPAQCPVCKAPASAFVEKTGNTYVTEHVVGIGKAEGVPQEIVDGLRANFEGECSEVGMYRFVSLIVPPYISSFSQLSHVTMRVSSALDSFSGYFRSSEQPFASSASSTAFSISSPNLAAFFV